MLSQAVSLRRLRTYAEICRQQARDERNEALRAEQSKFADAFRRAADEIEAINEVEPSRSGGAAAGRHRTGAPIPGST